MKKAIKLGFFLDGTQEAYRVLSIVDSLLVNPGDILSKDQVKDLCQLKQWRVTIVPDPTDSSVHLINF